MPLAVATRTVIHRRWRARFMWGSLRVAFQARRSPGYLGGALRIDRGPVFWTLTRWQDGAAMNGFRDSGAHRELIPRMAGWASQASMTAWKADADPSWVDVFERMDLNPHWLDIDRPDERHREKRLDRPSTSGLALRVPRRLTQRKPLVKGVEA